MSPVKSPGQLAGQLLDESARELVGRAVDIEWRPDRPHVTWLVDAPPEVVDQLNAADRNRVASTQWLAWSPCFDDACECQRSPDTEGVLDSFLALEDGTVDEIESFMFRYGPIAGCAHLRAHDCEDLLEAADPELVYWEAPTIYRDYARRFRRILQLATAIHEGEAGDIEDWTSLLADTPLDHREGLDDWFTDALVGYDTEELVAAGIDRWLPPSDPRVFVEQVLVVGIGSELLGRIVHYLMSDTPVEVGLKWPISDDGIPERPQIRLVGDTFGVLTFQLAIAIQGGLFAICSNCQRTYAPKRKPQAGRDNYCFACRDARKLAYKRRKLETKVGN